MLCGPTDLMDPGGRSRDPAPKLEDLTPTNAT